jgi:hypothetical protein
MLKRYETLDDFLSFDGHGCTLCGGPGFSKDCLPRAREGHHL